MFARVVLPKVSDVGREFGPNIVSTNDGQQLTCWWQLNNGPVVDGGLFAGESAHTWLA